MILLFVWICQNSAFAKETVDPMRFVLQGNGGNCTGCEWVLAEGKITSDTPKKFSEFIEASGFSPSNILINSRGGNLLAGLELGRLFRKVAATVSIGSSERDEYGFFKQTAGVCISACAYAFLGGSTRWLTEGDKLGFHQFFDKRAIADLDADIFDGNDRYLDQLVSGFVANYLIEMGIDHSFSNEYN